MGASIQTGSLWWAIKRLCAMAAFGQANRQTRVVVRAAALSTQLQAEIAVPAEKSELRSDF
jgi:hypothetical protein